MFVYRFALIARAIHMKTSALRRLADIAPKEHSGGCSGVAAGERQVAVDEQAWRGQPTEEMMSVKQEKRRENEQTIREDRYDISYQERARR